ncbi:hypothetical protein [Fictibacillus phosphorivorans]|nr:hypothetical protein [Fictibacillus phosphorivorans]
MRRIGDRVNFKKCNRKTFEKYSSRNETFKQRWQWNRMTVRKDF